MLLLMLSYLKTLIKWLSNQIGVVQTIEKNPIRLRYLESTFRPLFAVISHSVYIPCFKRPLIWVFEATNLKINQWYRLGLLQ